jgi:hypothetical protein
MKASRCTRARWIPLAVAATLMGKLAVTAQNWQTVDDFAFAVGDAEARCVAVDSAGRIYVVGTASGHAIVRYSADAGSNWVTRDDFVYPSQSYNSFNAITLEFGGAVYAGGASGDHWIVRRSVDHGVTWQTVDDYYRPMLDPSHPGTNGAVYSLSSDGQNRIYGTGLMRETGPSYNNWWVRGSDIGGTNWNAKLLLFSGYTEVSQITWAGEDVYVTGTVSGGEVFSGLMVRSSNYGATWTTNFAATAETYKAITSDSAGNIYAAGNRRSGTVDWLVRKAAPGGTNWTVLDKLTYEGDPGSGVDYPVPSSVAIDALGNICVAGQFLDYYETNGQSGVTWFTRQYSVAADQWSTTDLFSYSTNRYGGANGTAIAPDCTTFVVGYGTTESGQHRWVVRKRAADTRPRLQIALGNGSVAVSWPAAATNSVLEWSDSGGVNKVWQLFNGNVTVVNGRKTATLGPTPGARFFRLKNATGN